MKTLIISQKNHSGDFSTITQALKSIPKESAEPVALHIEPGIYKEKITIDRNNITLVGLGSCPEETVLSYDDYAFAKMEDGTNRGTFRSYSVFVDARDVTLKNLTVANTSGDENQVGQAIALYVDGDRFLCEDCRLLGRQDTLFTGPLPLKELQPGGFIGPKQFAPRINGRHLYRNCYICGNVDFIFGSATAYFDHCTLESLSHGPKAAVQGYVAAPSTPQGQAYGYVFQNCSFQSRECPEKSVYLARPWRDYAKSVFRNCTLGPHIHPELFHDWNKPTAREHCFFAISPGGEDFHSRFPAPAPFSRILSPEEEMGYTMEVVLGGADHWRP